MIFEYLSNLEVLNHLVRKKHEDKLKTGRVSSRLTTKVLLVKEIHELSLSQKRLQLNSKRCVQKNLSQNCSLPRRCATKNCRLPRSFFIISSLPRCKDPRCLLLITDHQGFHRLPQIAGKTNKTQIGKSY